MNEVGVKCKGCRNLLTENVCGCKDNCENNGEYDREEKENKNFSYE